MTSTSMGKDPVRLPTMQQLQNIALPGPLQGNVGEDYL
jgi:hypothetical protein